MNVKYPNLIKEIAVRGIKKKAIANQLDISERSFYSKLNGDVSFTWEETGIIQSCFFPDKTKEELFAPGEEKEVV